jgi:hypothetical protein
MHHAIKKGDSKMIFKWMEIAIPAFKAARKPHYTQLSIDFMIRFKSWSDEVISMMDGVMFVHTSSGISQPLDECVEFVNLHAKSRNHKTDCANFGANISSSTYMRMCADELIHGLQEIRGLSCKTSETHYTTKQQEIITEMTKIIVLIWPIVGDRDIKVCNILNENPEQILTPPNMIIDNVFSKAQNQVKERGKVFENMFQNEKNHENPTVVHVTLSREEKLEEEAELRSLNELMSDELEESDSEGGDEEFVLPKFSVILGKLKNKKSLLISQQKTHSKTRQDQMDIEEVQRVTLEEPIERPAKRVLRERE